MPPYTGGMDIPLSPHFTLSELTHSQTAARHGIDNRPTDAALAVAHAIQRSGIAFDQLLHEFDAWVHISFAAHPRAQVLTIDARGTRPGLRALA